VYRVTYTGAEPATLPADLGRGGGAWQPRERRSLPERLALQIVVRHDGFRMEAETNTPSTPYATRLGVPRSTR